MLPLNHALVKNIAIHGFYWGGYAGLDPRAMSDSMNELLRMFADGQLAPVVGEVMPLNRIADAFDLLRSRKAVGKIVVTL